MLTKRDIAAIRQSDDMTVHLSARNPLGRVRLIKRKRVFDSKPFETDKEYILEEVRVTLEGFRQRKALEDGTANCFAMVGFYHNQYTPASGAMKTLRVGDEVTFEFRPDYHTNGYIAAAGLHADSLLMRVRRDGKTVATWTMLVSVCPSNSARMCRGVPDSDTYALDAAEARKIA